jgi:hypothetical protein
MNELINVILSFRNSPYSSIKAFVFDHIEWPLNPCFFELTGHSFSGVFNTLSDETSEFIANLRLQDSIRWLMTVAPDFFPGSNFEIDLLPAEDGENNLLALRVYSSFSAMEFRERRHRICEAMLAAKHTILYDVISIFQ